MKLTRQHRRKARILWQSICIESVPDEQRLREAVQALRRSGDRDAEPVLRCLEQRLMVHVRLARVSVVSAEDLPAQIRAEILSRLLSQTVAANVEFSVEPGVLGGVRLEKGYDVTDATVGRQLEVLKHKLLMK